MKTYWTWSHEDEARRIALACANIANGFYQNQGYTVLPLGSVSPSPTTTIYLPNLSYSTIPRYWETLGRVNFGDPQINVDRVIAPLIKPLVSRLQLAGLFPVKNHLITRVWEKYQHQVLHDLCQTLNLPLHQIRSLTVQPSQCGSIASFTPVENMPANIDIKLRHDQGVRTLVNVIIMSLLTRKLSKDHNATWKQIKFLADWIVEESPLSHLLNKIDPLTYQGSVKSLYHKSFQQELLRLSHTFLENICAPQSKSKFQVVADKIMYQGRSILYLTQREKSILTELIKNAPKIVSNDTISDILFQSPEDYSLSVITKTIQHLRDKIEKNGIPSSAIKTVYSQGYSLR